MHLFYLPQLSSSMQEVTLSEDESKHACRVLRLKSDDLVTLLDGVGGTYEAKIIDDNPKRCQVTILDYKQDEKPSFDIHIAIAPTKNMDRLEWFVEKATELGVTRISLLLCDHSERKVVKLDRIEKIVVAAVKQSKRTYFPVLDELQSFQEFIKNHPVGAIAHCEDEEKKMIDTLATPFQFPVLIGPEGDFSLKEIEAAKKSGYQFISLGKTRLRTETAGLYACMALKSKFE